MLFDTSDVLLQCFEGTHQLVVNAFDRRVFADATASPRLFGEEDWENRADLLQLESAIGEIDALDVTRSKESTDAQEPAKLLGEGEKVQSFIGSLTANMC